MSLEQTLNKTATEAFEEAYSLLLSEEDWKEAKRNELGDIVMTKKNKRGKNIYKIKAEIDTSPEKLIKALKDVANSDKWNKTLEKLEVVSDISDDLKVTYQITSEAGGVVSARDFILVLKFGYKNDAYLQAACSVEYPGLEKVKGMVRAWNYPGGLMVKPVLNEPNKSEFQWLIDCDLKGWLPASMVSMAMPFMQMQYVTSIRELAKTL